MKKTVLFIILVLLVAGIYSAWKVFGPTVSAPEKKYFYIKTGSGYDDVTKSLVDQKIIPGTFFFNLVAKQVKYNTAIC